MLKVDSRCALGSIGKISKHRNLHLSHHFIGSFSYTSIGIKNMYQKKKAEKHRFSDEFFLVHIDALNIQYTSMA